MIINDPEMLRNVVNPWRPKSRRVWNIGGSDYNISSGQSECGYDMTLADTVVLHAGHTTLGVTYESVNMPLQRAGIIRTKSTWARLGIYLNDPMIDPGFIGQITLEIVYNPLWEIGPPTLELPANLGIGCFLMYDLATVADYSQRHKGLASGACGSLLNYGGKYDGRNGMEEAK